jgi:methylglutaconyl-CoA hydratase
MSNVLRIERSGPVGRVWLDRPDVRNALNGALIRELAAAFTAFAANGGVRAIVLGGSGKAFCAGADLAFMREAGSYTWEQNRADAEALAEMLWTLYSLPGAGGRAHPRRLLRRRRSASPRSATSASSPRA